MLPTGSSAADPRKPHASKPRASFLDLSLTQDDLGRAVEASATLLCGRPAMKCTRCQRENAADMSFCGDCGARLAVLCPSCGAANAPVNKFCGKCGARLSPAPAV